MNERRRPTRRGRGHRPPNRPPLDSNTESSPYRDDSSSAGAERYRAARHRSAPIFGWRQRRRSRRSASAAAHYNRRSNTERSRRPWQRASLQQQPQQQQSASARTTVAIASREQPDNGNRENGNRDIGNNANGRRGRRGRQRNGPRPEQTSNAPVSVLVADGTTTGWFDPARDGGFIRRARHSYLADAGDAYVPPHIVRQYALRKSDDLIEATTGRDPRGRTARRRSRRRSTASDPTSVAAPPRLQLAHRVVSGAEAVPGDGRPAKGGPELTRRAIDLIAPIGYGQRALIVAPARAGKTTLLHAITEGVAINHPERDAAHPARRRASRRSERGDLVGRRRSHLVELRSARGAPRRSHGDGARARASPRRERARTW